MDDAEFFHLYRFHHEDGSAKEWAIRTNEDGTFTVRWGKAGKLVQSNTRSQKWSGEVDDLIRRKTAKGYNYAGECTIDHDHKPVMASAGKSGKQPGIYWDIRLFEYELLPNVLAELREIAEILAGLGIAKRTSEGFRIRRWEFPRESRLAGTIYPEHGPYPLLVMLALKRSKIPGVEVGIADEDGVELSTRLQAEKRNLAYLGGNFEKVRKAAEALDLMTPKVRLDLIETDIPDMYF